MLRLILPKNEKKKSLCVLRALCVKPKKNSVPKRKTLSSTLIEPSVFFKVVVIYCCMGTSKCIKTPKFFNGSTECSLNSFDLYRRRAYKNTFLRAMIDHF